MSSKGRQIAKNIGKSLKKKLETDLFQFPFGIDDHQKDIVFLQAPFSISPQRSPPLSAKKSRKMHSPHSPKKSNSLSTITVPEGNRPGIVDHDEIIALTHDVKKFSDSLARLKVLFTEGFVEEDDPKVVTHECLGEVLSVLNPLMQHYPALQSPDIFTAARSLITMIKDHNYEEDISAPDLQGFCEAIDQLALAFSSSVSEYLMGDMGPQMLMDFKTKSMNNIAGADAYGGGEAEDQATSLLSTRELDTLLVDLDSGLTLSLQRAKAWSKYIHDIISYMEKKAQLEYDYAKNLSRVVHSVQNNLKKEGFLPLQSVYCTALAHDEEFVSNLQATQSILHKFIEPLIARRSEHDKVYKSVKEAWHREHRRMSDSVTNLRKAQALYQSRRQDHERARELSLKAEGDKQEKRRKAEEDTMHKAAEAETTYKACVAEANYRQQELFKVKHELLAKIREQIEMCDQVIKNITVEYFQLYQTVVSPLPLQYQTLSESSKGYVPGSQYAEYMHRLPPNSPKVQPQNFMFEPYIHSVKSPESSRKESVHSNGSMSDATHSPDGSPIASPRRDKYRIPVKAWSHGYGQGANSDTDSASCSSKSHESSPSGSPHGASRRHLITSQSLDELTEEELIAAAAAASSYNVKGKRPGMKRTITLEGDATDMHGLLLPRGRRNTTFGVDFQEQVNAFQTKVPPIISKCLTEIEKRGLMIKGIYRVSGVKSKVEHLCQRFDIDPEAVGLEDVHPNIISNVLKLYLRQLPEPLLTFRLYSEFIHVAKANMSGQLKGEELIEHLRKLVKRLPSSNMRTCAVLMHHLQRVAAHAELNQMNASNLGIVFGPTLLRPLEGSASLASLVDTPHQTRAIELLIFYAQAIFGPSEDFQVAPSQTPIEKLSAAQSDVHIPDKTPEMDKRGIPHITKSPVSDSSDSSVPVFDLECPNIGLSSATQPSASEYVLPGTASSDRNESHSLSPHGLELILADSRSDEDEDLPEIDLPDQSKPQSEPLSVILSPRCVAGHKDDIHYGQSGVSSLAQPITTKGPVPKSASTPAVSKETLSLMPSSLSAPMTVTPSDNLSSKETSPCLQSSPMEESEKKASLASPQSSKMHESHSAGDLIGWNDKPVGDDGKPGALDITRKKLHSQKLENIKFLTKAPSLDEVTGIMEELIVKSGNISPNLSSAQRSPQAQKRPSVKSTTPEPADDLVITENQALKPESSSVSQVSDLCISGKAQATYTETTQATEQIEKKDEAMSSATKCTPAQSKSSRKSILEEMPIPTVCSQPLSQGDENKADRKESKVLPVTIPASPTIKRREIPTKIPSSPTSTRIASTDPKTQESKTCQEQSGDSRANKFRQEQRKLVSAIKTASTRSSSSRPGSSSDNLTEIHEKKSLSSTNQSISVTTKDESILTGGCALTASSRSGSKDREQSPVKDSSGTESSTKLGPSELKMSYSAQAKVTEVESMSLTKSQGKSSSMGSPRPASAHMVNIKQDQTSMKQRPSTPDGTEKSGSKSRNSKPRAIALPSTVFVKKEANSTSSMSTSSSLLSKSSTIEKVPQPKSSTSSLSSSLVKQRSFSSSSKEQSPTMCPRAVAMSKSVEGKMSKSGQFTARTVTKAGDVSNVKALKSIEGDRGKGEPPSHSKPVPVASTSSPTHVRTRRTSGGSPSTISPTSSPKRSTRPPQRKSSTGGVIVVSSRRTQEKQMTASAHGQSTSVSATRSVQSSVTLSSQSSSDANTSSTATTTSGSNRLSQDRTPRFV